MKNILIIEDEFNSISYLKTEFLKEGYAISQIENSKIALKVLEEKNFDVIIIDSTDNVNICNQIKSRYNIPIIAFLNQIEEQNCNADEYIIKPFNTPQLFSSIQKYTGKKSAGVKYTFKELVLDNDKCEAIFYGEILELTKKEYDILLLLVKNKNDVLSRDDLLNHVWGIDYLGETNVVDVNIKHLRDKFAKYSKAEYIKTIRGIGYSCCEA